MTIKIHIIITYCKFFYFYFMKKVRYDIFDSRHGYYWGMEFSNKRDAESYLYHALRDEYYDKVDPYCYKLREYIKDRRLYLKVVDRTPED